MPLLGHNEGMTTTELSALEDDCIQILQELIRIPSVNYGEGKGDEEAVARYVVAKLAEVGIDSELIETGPKRFNVVARIAGRDTVVY